MTDIATYTGLDLKVARVRARVKQREIGLVMGVTESRISSIEREGIVTSDTARRYLAALDTCSTARTSMAS